MRCWMLSGFELVLPNREDYLAFWDSLVHRSSFQDYCVLALIFAIILLIGLALGKLFFSHRKQTTLPDDPHS